MKTAFLIAWRYFFSKKKTNFINIISVFSMFGVAVGAMSLVIVLSVFNGLEGLIRSLYGSFDPDLKITAVEGKSFVVSPSLVAKIKGIDAITEVTEVIEDNALVKYKDKQIIVRLKGVKNNFKSNHKIEAKLVQGKSYLANSVDKGIIGRGIQFKLGLALEEDYYPLQLWYPKPGAGMVLNPENAFNRDLLVPTGIFSIEKQYDDNFIFAPLSFVQQLMNYENKRTSLEISVLSAKDIPMVQEKVKGILGNTFSVLNSDEQHVSLLRAIKIEKMFVFLTFTFILGIASINIFFSLTLLAIEKQKDVAILYAMGASRAFIRQIFLLEGGIIALIGTGLGLSLGFSVCWAQQNFHFISMGMKTSVIDAYPVLMKSNDFVVTACTVIVITIVSSYSPAHQASKVDVRSQL